MPAAYYLLKIYSQQTVERGQGRQADKTATLQHKQSQQVCTNLKCWPKKSTTTRTGKTTTTTSTTGKKPNARKFSNKIHKHESAIIRVRDTVGESSYCVSVSLYLSFSLVLLFSLFLLLVEKRAHKTSKAHKTHEKTKQLLIIFNEIPNKHVKANECHFKKVKACGMRRVCVGVCMARGMNVLQG